MKLVLLSMCSVMFGCSLVTCPDCFEDGEEVDASADSGVLDTDLNEPDGRSVCGTCMTPLPHCDEETETCVECVEDDHCPDDGFCRSGSCAACRGDSDCTTPEAPVCSVNTDTLGQCVPCEEDSGCGEIRVMGTDLSTCDVRREGANMCVECNGGADECDGFVCDVQARECTMLARDTALTCTPCISSAQCSAGNVCAQEIFAGAPTGFYCLRPASTGCPLARVYAIDSWMSIEGEEVEVCHPSSTTCKGLLDDTASCDDSSMCGVPDVDDAVCEVPTGRCAHLCAGESDCLAGETCPLETPRVCVP